MLAAQYRTSGPSAGQLEVVELPRPEAAAGGVLVRVRLSGVNPTDWKSRRPGGFTAAGHDAVVPNQDGAGEIVSVGDGVDPARVGERVWVYQAQWPRAHGTAAQFVAVPAEQAVPLPDDASLALAAGLGIPAMTAHRCLLGDGAIDGLRVLVHGGAGAVGHAAIELARWGGARVAATVSSDEKAQLAAAAGAELVIDYRTEDPVAAVREWAPRGVHRVVDVDVAQNLSVDARVLAPAGVISAYSLGPEPVALTPMLMALNAELRFVLVYTIPDAAKRRAATDIDAALRAGALTALEGPRFPLAEIADAHDAVEHGVLGKVLVEVPGA
jgi:NADPH2:quinone reductase